MSFNYADILKVFMKYSYLGPSLKLLCTIVVFPLSFFIPYSRVHTYPESKFLKSLRKKNQKIISLDLHSWGCFNHAGHRRQRTRWNDLVRLISKFLILFSHTVVARHLLHPRPCFWIDFCLQHPGDMWPSNQPHLNLPK